MNRHLDNYLTILNKIAQKYNQPLEAIHSGFSDRIPDMGSSDITLIKKQRVHFIFQRGRPLLWQKMKTTPAPSGEVTS